MLTITEIKAEGEPAADGSGRSGNDGRSGTVFICGSFHRQTLAPTHHRVSGLPSHLILLGGENIIHQINLERLVGSKLDTAMPAQ
jgi:hypothetical protein